MKKLALFTSILLSSFSLFACSEDDVSPIEILSITQPDGYGDSTIRIRAVDDVIIDDIIVNRGRCILAPLGILFLKTEEDLRENKALIERARLDPQKIYGSQRWEYAHLVKDKVYQRVFPSPLQLAQTKIFTFHCKGFLPILEISIKTDRGEWEFK